MHQTVGPFRPLSPAECERLYRELGTCRAVAEHLGLPDPKRRGRQRVWNRLKQAGQELRGPSWRKLGDAEDRRRVNAINESASLADAERRLGLNAGTLHSWLRDRGWRAVARLAVYGPKGKLL